MVLINNRYKPYPTPPARGGMSSVLRCEDTVLKRDVAIKFLAPGTKRQRLMDEIAALHKVRSPHVVQMYDVVIVPPDSRIGIVQEFVDGDDLLKLAAAGLPPARILAYLHQIACGLADVHQSGVIHRDIKPNNMKVDGGGVVKLFDFGLARELDKAATGGFNGTVGFAAPELWKSGIVSFTTAVDVYAFACTALWLSSNGLPTSLVQAPPSPTGTEFAGFPLHKQISTKLALCLSVNPAFRPGMAEIRDLLRKHLAVGKHRAVVTHQGQIYNLDLATPSITLNRPGSPDSIQVDYDGLDFVVRRVTGQCFVNNIPITVGLVLDGSCLITLGVGKSREFSTFDVSHPEVVI